MHLHGAYCSELGIDDIVAGVKQYEDIIADKGAQFIQNLIGTHPLIIVGCGKNRRGRQFKRFFEFLFSRYIKTDVPYFYLYKKAPISKACLKM